MVAFAVAFLLAVSLLLIPVSVLMAAGWVIDGLSRWLFERNADYVLKGTEERTAAEQAGEPQIDKVAEPIASGGSK